jgi:hypothetical protein
MRESRFTDETARGRGGSPRGGAPGSPQWPRRVAATHHRAGGGSRTTAGGGGGGGRIPAERSDPSPLHWGGAGGPAAQPSAAGGGGAGGGGRASGGGGYRTGDARLPAVAGARGGAGAAAGGAADSGAVDGPCTAAPLAATAAAAAASAAAEARRLRMISLQTCSRSGRSRGSPPSSQLPGPGPSESVGGTAPIRGRKQARIHEEQEVGGRGAARETEAHLWQRLQEEETGGAGRGCAAR